MSTGQTFTQATGLERGLDLVDPVYSSIEWEGKSEGNRTGDEGKVRSGARRC